MGRYVILGMVGDESDGGPDQSVDEATSARQAMTYLHGLGRNNFEALITPEGSSISRYDLAEAFLKQGQAVGPAKSWDPNKKKFVKGKALSRGPGGRFAKKSSSSRTVRRGTMGPKLPGGGFYSTGKKNYCRICGGPHKFKHGRA